MRGTTSSHFNSVTKQHEMAKEKPMKFTSSHSPTKEDSHVIAGLLAQLAEKEQLILDHVAALEAKDAIISHFAATCDRLKHDCEVLAEKAFEWKHKYDQVVGAAPPRMPQEPKTMHEPKTTQEAKAAPQEELQESQGQHQLQAEMLQQARLMDAVEWTPDFETRPRSPSKSSRRRKSKAQE
ncbi:unnamed protein product [Aphanomyces euteiches]